MKRGMLEVTLQDEEPEVLLAVLRPYPNQSYELVPGTM